MTDTYQPSETYNPLRIKIGGPPVAEGDPWAGALTDRPEAAQSGSTTDAWAGALTERPATKAEETKARETAISAPAAAAMGVAEGASFGAAPAIAGVHAAGMSLLPKEAKDAVEKYGHSAVLGPLLAGLGRLGYENLIAPALGEGRTLSSLITGDTSGPGTKAYTAAREAYGAEQQAASEQHPIAYTAGQVGGSLATPGFGVGAGTTTAARIGSGITSGAIGGGLYGAGQAISENQDPLGIAGGAASGAATGGVFGGAGAGLLSAAQKGASKVASIFRGAKNTDAEAARRIIVQLRADFKANGDKWTPETRKAAQDAGIPLGWVDRGGEGTRALARSAANESPQGRQALTDVFDPRFEEQSTRAGRFIRNLTGGGRAVDDLEKIDQVARTANAPAYKRAYAAGDRPIWSPELERLMNSGEIAKATRGAVKRWGDFQVRDGYGGLNPPVKVTPDGRFVSTGGRGIPTYPNIQFWDYAARNLARRAEQARSKGDKTSALLYGDLERQLKAALDKQVPEYAAARQGAHIFFGAENALEAGKNFVMSTATGKAELLQRRAIAKMSPAEKELFAHGFASELADKFEKIGFNRDILNSVFVNNAAAKQRIEQALGPDRAARLEAYLRAESLVNQSRKAMGGSTTARQLKEYGLASGGLGGAVAGYDELTGQDFDPKRVIYAALFGGGLRYGAHKIDAKVAQRVAEMLASNDPNILDKGVKIVASRPYLMDALRRATGAGARVAAHDIGPTRAIAGAGAVLGSVLTPPEAKSVNPYSNSQFVNQ